MITGVETVKVIRKSSSTVDAYGNPVFTETEINFRDVLIGWGSGDEPVEVDSRPQVGKVTLYFQPGSVIHDTDEFEFHNQRWVKDGRVQDWTSPFHGFETGPVVIVRQQLG
jgi:hypothetical protein